MPSALALAGQTIAFDETEMADPTPEHVTTTEARAGATPHMTRYVLVFGTALVVIAFAIILLVAS